MTRLLLAALIVGLPAMTWAHGTTGTSGNFDSSAYGFNPYFDEPHTTTTQLAFDPSADSIVHPYAFEVRGQQNNRHDVSRLSCSPTLGCFTNTGALCSANPSGFCDIQTTPAGRCSGGDTVCVWPGGAGRCTGNSAIGCLTDAYVTCLKGKQRGTSPFTTVCNAASGPSSLCAATGNTNCDMALNNAACDCQGYDSSGATGGWEGDVCGSTANQAVCSDGDDQRDAIAFGLGLCVELCTSAACTPASGCGGAHTAPGTLSGSKYPNSEAFDDAFTLQRTPGAGLTIAGSAGATSGGPIIDVKATFVTEWDLPGKGAFAANGLRRMQGWADSWHQDQTFSSVAINAVTDVTGPINFLCPVPAGWQSGLPIRAQCGALSASPGAFCIRDADCGCTVAPCGNNICDPTTFQYCHEAGISNHGWLYTRNLNAGEKTGPCPPNCRNQYDWTTFEEEAFIHEFFFSGDPRIGSQLIFNNLEGSRAGKGDAIQVFPLVSLNTLFFGDLRCHIGGNPARLVNPSSQPAPCNTLAGAQNCIGRCLGSVLPCDPTAPVGANGCSGGDQCMYCGGTSSVAPNSGNTTLPLVGGVRGHDPARGNVNASPVGYNTHGFNVLSILGRIGHVNGVSTNLNVPLFVVRIHGPVRAEFRDNTCQGAAGVDKCDLGEIQAGTGAIGIGAGSTFTAGTAVPFDPGSSYAVSRTIAAANPGTVNLTLLASGDWGAGVDGIPGCLGDNAPVANNPCSHILGIAPGFPGSSGSDDPPILRSFATQEEVTGTGMPCSPASATCRHADVSHLGKVQQVDAYTPTFTNVTTLTIRDLAAITNTNGLDVIAKSSVTQCPMNVVTGDIRCRDVDTDGDRWLDDIDNCNSNVNQRQRDTGTLGGSARDSVGNTCQCGDVSANGQVTATDSLRINQALINLAPVAGTNGATQSQLTGTIWLRGRCNVSSATSDICNATDSLRIAQALAGVPVATQVAAVADLWRGFCPGEAHPDGLD
jgi:hypothetical protein